MGDCVAKIKGNREMAFNPSKSVKRKIAVVGAGISGLSAALRLVELCPDVQISLFDKRSRAGGVLNTQIIDGFEVEQSADNFITTVPWGLDLCRRLGLVDDVF